jgi:hypothetical protein
MVLYLYGHLAHFINIWYSTRLLVALSIFTALAVSLIGTYLVPILPKVTNIVITTIYVS